MRAPLVLPLPVLPALALLLAGCSGNVDSAVDSEPVYTSECDVEIDPCDNGAAWIRTCEWYPSIQAALDAADNGTTVHVCPGTHTESIGLDGDVDGGCSSVDHSGEHINLNGDGSGSTTIDATGGSCGSVLSVGEVDLDIAGVTLTGGTGRPVDGGTVGGGIYGVGARLVLSDVVITGNRADLGGGLGLRDSEVKLTSSAVTANVGLAGGGAELFDSGTLQSITSDWGEGPTDNTPDDVVLAAATSSSSTWGSNASFACDVATLTCAAD